MLQLIILNISYSSTYSSCLSLASAWLLCILSAALLSLSGSCTYVQSHILPFSYQNVSTGFSCSSLVTCTSSRNFAHHYSPYVSLTSECYLIPHLLCMSSQNCPGHVCIYQFKTLKSIHSFWRIGNTIHIHTIR